MNFFQYIKVAVKTLPAKGRRNGIKILTLSLGLAVGLVLASKVCFEQTYDDFHADASRIVYLSETTENNGVLGLYAQTSGGVAPTMKEHYPEIELASRSTLFETGASLIDAETGQRFAAPQVILADSCYFQLFNRECMAGNITSALGLENQVAISSHLAVAMASSSSKYAASKEVIGKKFTIGSRGAEQVFTVVGVFEDFPANSTSRPDVVIALPSIGRFMYDGSMGLLGNDRYQSYLKLRSGFTAQDLNDKMDSFIQKYLPLEEMKAANFYMTYTAKPLTGYHLESADIRNTILVLGIVAFALLLASVLNYMLIVISTCVTRGKEMAIRKCMGSDEAETAKMMFAEAVVHTFLATLLASVFLLAGRGYVENFLGIGLDDLFTGKPLVIALAILFIVVLLNGYVPTRIFCGIPVATAFRNYRENRRVWKRWLLVVEFALVSFLCVLIGTISVQYNSLIHAQLGFSYENNVEIAIPESSPSQHIVLMNELWKMPEVADACSSFLSVFPGFTGNGVRLPGQENDLFNAYDLYYVDDHWLNTLGMTLKEGRNFNPELSSDQEVLVDTQFVEELKITAGWDDVIGRQITVTEHGDNVTIVGVFEPINLAQFDRESADYTARPKMVFYCSPTEDMGQNYYPYLNVRLDEFSSASYQRVLQVVENTLPDQASYINPVKDLLISRQSKTLETRNAILVGSFITLLIALLGLIGYTIDEVKRRAKEIAIRRVSGAHFSQIRLMFQKETLCFAVPSALIGCLAGVVVALRWEENFTLQVGMPWWVVAGAFLFTLVLVALVSDLFVSRIANANPVESIKTE